MDHYIADKRRDHFPYMGRMLVMGGVAIAAWVPSLKGWAPDSEAAMTKATPLLELLGTNILHMGGPGAGQHTKMCNQILACSNMIGVAESLRYATAAGLDAHKVVDAIGAGAAGSWAMQNLGHRVVDRDFAPGFMIEHMAKDLGIAVAEAERMGLALPGLANARKLYDTLLKHGHGRDGTQALILAIEELAMVG